MITILEDEFFVAHNLEKTLVEQGHEVRLYKSPNEILKAFKDPQKRTDLALVDINLNAEMDGVEVATTLQKLYGTQFVFVTALSDSETLDRVKGVKPLAYIIKPFTDSEIKANVEIALFKLSKLQATKPSQALPEFTFLKNKEGLVKVNYADIVLVHGGDIELAVYTINMVHRAESTLEEFVQKIRVPYLIQVHRQYLINIHYLHSIFGNMAIVGKREVPIGKAYRDALDKFIVL